MNNIWKYRYTNHEKNKDVLLDTISSCDFEIIKTHDDSISKSDYYLDTSRPYLNILMNDLKDFQQIMLDHYCCSEIHIIGAWFQQYNNSDVHNWHIHASCNISVVYFLELHNENDSTEFFDLSSRKSFQLENVKEGDLLIFPGFIPHRTPQNKFLDRRTIIAFNLNFGSVNMNLLPGGS